MNNQPQVYLQNKNSLDLSEDNLDAHYGDNSLVVMKNDFYNEDFYDYKDTFLSKLEGGKSAHRQLTSDSTKLVKIETGEDYEDDLGTEDDDQDIDYNNDFTTGPLAVKKKSIILTDKESGQESGYDNNNFDNDAHFKHNEFMTDEYEEHDENLMCDTFFKRVDSMELSKPKKAKVVNNYLVGELLGDGSYGKVKECIDLKTLSRRAVKIINLKLVGRKIPRGVENVRKEINIMKRLNHTNVIKLYDTYEKQGQTLQQEQNIEETKTENCQNDILGVTSTMVNIEKPPKLYIFMDYCMTSLEKLLKTAPDQRLRNWQANHYFKQIVDGLEYLHSLNIIHNDIKPGNLLITCDDTLKICDFSISAEMKIFYEHEYLEKKENNCIDNELDYDSETDINPQLIESNRQNSNNNRNRFPILQCTPMFQCPEMLDEDIDELMILKNAPKIDIWSTGITLFQITSGKLPFEGQTIHQIFENIRSASYEILIPDYIDKNLNELLTNMLNRNPVKRWSLHQIRESMWFCKKHPFVPDDIANLPEDVIQNEYATFRMINYLEKFCELKAVTELTSNDFSRIYDDIANQSVNNHMDPHFANMNINQESSTQNKNQSYTQTNNETRSIEKQTKEYSHANKIKKSHCSVM